MMLFCGVYSVVHSIRPVQLLAVVDTLFFSDPSKFEQVIWPPSPPLLEKHINSS